MNRLSFLALLLACAPAWAQSPLIGDVRFPERFDDVRETSAFRGTVALAVLVLESKGPASRFDWDAWRVQQVMDQVDAMRAWWNAQGSGQGLQVIPAPDHYGRVVEIGLEPLDGTHLSTQQCQWYGAAMEALGFPDGCMGAVQDFDEAMAQAAGAPQAATLFVIDDGGTGASFENGGTAWAWWGGPSAQVTYSNGGWGIDNLGLVAGHELAHVFHAFDEYSQSGYSVCSCDDHWNGCANENCMPVTGLPCAGWHDVCLMAPEQQEAWATHHLCAATTCHLGWDCGAETCNGLDDDCDAAIDEELGTETCGVGACAHEAPVCVSGKLVPCDPLEGAGPEICNGIDDDCDGHTDSLPPGGGGMGGGALCDADGDGYCDAAGSCTGVSPGCPFGCGDCDDADASVHEGRQESCNGRDDDCNGVTDDPGALACTLYYVDADGDGVGAAGSGECLCAATADHPTPTAGDCDDADASVAAECHAAPPDEGAAEVVFFDADASTGDAPTDDVENDGTSAASCAFSDRPLPLQFLTATALVAGLSLLRVRRKLDGRPVQTYTQSRTHRARAVRST